MIWLRNTIWIGLGLWLLIAVAAHAEDQVVVDVGADVSAANTANGHAISSVRALVQAYEAQKAELARWKAYARPLYVLPPGRSTVKP